MFETQSDGSKSQPNLQNTKTNKASSKNILWVQEELEKGTWVACAKCSRWRHLPMLEDPSELPELWYCHMNPDSAAAQASCGLAEAVLSVEQEEELVECAFAAGSVVWARLPTWPAWPALVDHCPDHQLFYWLDGFTDIPTHYHVVFFDDKKEQVTRAWIPRRSLTPYKNSGTTSETIPKKFQKRMNVAKKLASEALKLTLGERLEKFGFLANYKGWKKSSKGRNDKKYIKRLYASNDKSAKDLKSWRTADLTGEDGICEPLPSKKRKTIKTRSEYTHEPANSFTYHSKHLPNSTVDMVDTSIKDDSSKVESNINTHISGDDATNPLDKVVTVRNDAPRADDNNNQIDTTKLRPESTQNIHNPSQELDTSNQYQEIFKTSQEAFVELKASVAMISKSDSANETYEDYGNKGKHTNDGNLLIPSTIIDNAKSCMTLLQPSQGSDDFEF